MWSKDHTYRFSVGLIVPLLIDQYCAGVCNKQCLLSIFILAENDKYSQNWSHRQNFVVGTTISSESFSQILSALKLQQSTDVQI